MKKRVELLLDSGEIINIDEKFGMGINYSVENLKDISKRSASFTKTIIIPGTKEVNKIFGYLFDISSDFTYFNPNFKTLCKILVDKTTVLNGYLQLRKIDKQNDGDLIYYEVVVNEEAIDFFSLMGEKFLTNIDYSELDHTYGYSTIKESWTGGTFENKLVYPILYKNNNKYETQDFKPAVYLKYHLNKIAQDNGFSLGGSFLDDPTFSREIIPYNGGQPKISITDAESRQFSSTISAGAVVIPSYVVPGTWAPNVNVNLTQLDLDDDPNGVWNLTNNQWTVNKNGKYTFTTDLAFKYDISAQADTYLRIDSTGGGNSPIPFWMELAVFINGVYTNSLISNTESLPYNRGGGPSIFVNPAFGTDNGTTWTSWFDISGNILEDVVLNTGDVIKFKVIQRTDSGNEIKYARDTSEVAGGLFETTVAVEPITSIAYVRTNLRNTTKPTKFKVTAVREYLTDGDDLIMNDYIPLKVKQKDLFGDLIKRYNLIITSDPLNSKNILLETRDDFYNQSGAATLDWTDKKDHSYNDQIELLSELQSKKIKFTYKKGKDSFADTFERITGGVIYGEKEIEYVNEFVKGEKKVESLYSSTSLVYNSLDKVMVIPKIDSKIPKSNVKVLQYGGLIDTLEGKTWSFNYLSGGNRVIVDNTTYPYAGHWDNPFTPSSDNHFSSILNLPDGAQVQEWYSESISGALQTNLYNVYWSNYINQIDDGKLVTMRLALDEEDIKAVKDNFETIIFIDGTYYTLNVIQDYDPTKEGGLTIVKLLKTKRATSFPTQQPSAIEDEGVDIIIQSTEMVVRPPDDTPARPLKTTQDFSNTTIRSEQAVVIGEDNTISSQSTNVAIIGTNSTIENNVSNSGILGSSGSRIKTGVNNSWVIGVDNVTVSRDNEFYIGNIHIVNGTIVSEWNVIDGGNDSLGYPQLYSTNRFNLIDGGEDEQRNVDYTNIQNLIDGGYTDEFTI